MALAPRLDLRQVQGLVMTPQLQQAIKLLQFSHLELAAFVDAELERNPLLDRDESAGDDGVARDGAEPSEQADIDRGRGVGDATNDADGRQSAGGDGDEAGFAADAAIAAGERDALESLTQDGAADESPLDIDAPPRAEAYAARDDAGDAGSGGLGLSGARPAGGRPAGDGDAMQELARPITLRDHVTAQMQIELIDPRERLIALHLIDLLDANGYLVGDVAELASLLGAPPEAIERVITRLQTLDPPGLFARSLAECLAIQLRERDRFDPAMAQMVAHLPLVALRDRAQLRAVCGVDEEDLRDMLSELRSLDPRPGLAFDFAPAEPITPEIILTGGAGNWLVELNPDTLPRVLLNTRYHARVSRSRLTAADKAYLAECHQSASWLVKTLHQRATTMIRVASEIVVQQDRFFRHGVSHLRPLVLRDIAGAVAMHESTISRVTSNKYMATPRGTFELKYFFTAGLASNAGGAAHSAEAVRHRIRGLIEREGAGVLSDDRLVELLQKDGVDIARRTVAKYRESLRIPSSIERRRRKNFASVDGTPA